jgi:NAD(P)H-dependent nitrite reductase small subunit
VNPDAFVPVTAAGQVGPGSSTTVVVGDREIALFNVDGRFYALDNLCPHSGGPLADGWLEGTTVTCPWHAWCFRLTDGTMTLGNFAHVDAFDVEVQDGTVFVAREPRARS